MLYLLAFAVGASFGVLLAGLAAACQEPPAPYFPIDRRRDGQ